MELAPAQLAITKQKSTGMDATAEALMAFAGGAGSNSGENAFFAPHTIDGLDAYIQEPIVTTPIPNVLDYWSVRSKTDPRLSKFAIDVLSLPGKFLSILSCSHKRTNYLLI